MSVEHLTSLIVLSPTQGTEASELDKKLDQLDPFNHPRTRRVEILRGLRQHDAIHIEVIPESSAATLLEDTYKHVCSTELLSFLKTSWQQWDALGREGQDPGNCLGNTTCTSTTSPPLIPSSAPLFRSSVPHRPSRHVMGQMGYYCNDCCTPVFAELLQELRHDATLVQVAVQYVDRFKTIYLLQTHPGHHAAYDSFGGYCYLNHAAAVASLLLTQRTKVAILDVDYHVGNGSAEIFYINPDVMVVSLHCDPDWEYPFHTGFADDQGSGDGLGATLHLPLPPKTKWNEYRDALQRGLHKIQEFGAAALVVSLGLDTHDGDPCSIRRAGFCLEPDDYKALGASIAESIGDSIPVVFVQEGGYRMDQVGLAAANVVSTFASTRVNKM